MVTKSKGTTIQPLNSVFFTTASQGWAAGEGGTIVNTSNGGKTWAAQTTSSIENLNNIFFNSAIQGWAVGDGGTMLSTNNGGSIWTEQTSGTTKLLSSVFFTSDTLGWAVGNNGTILSTSNGGSNWATQMSGSTQSLKEVFFISATQGWAVGQSGTILSTNNGGLTWTAQKANTSQHLSSVVFTTVTNGWAVGSGGTILTTNNGGLTWTAQTSGSAEYLISVFFSSATQGWAIGLSGTILRTNNGGNTWIKQTANTTQNLRSVFFTSATQGWAAGSEGNLLSWQCAIPEINVKGNNVSIIDGDSMPSLSDSTDFGIVAKGTQRWYNIINTGTDTLRITSSSLTGSHATDFAISGMPTKIKASDSAKFAVTFTPTDTGTRIATLTIISNDASKASHNFAIAATQSTSANVVNFKELFLEINVYPNPVNNLLNIQLPDKSKTVEVFIFDTFGKVILNKSIDQNTLLDLTHLLTGIYTLSFRKEAEMINIKLLKM